MIPYNTNGDIWTFFLPSTGKVIRITATDKRRVSIQDAVMQGDEETLLELLNKSEEEFIVTQVNKVVSTSFGDLKFETITENGVTSNRVTYKKNALPDVLGDYLVKLYTEGCKKFEHYFKFIDNILNNHSERARNELYTFLASRHLPITDNGTFIAYKGLKSDMYSVNGNTNTRVLSGEVNARGQILNLPGSEIRVVTEDVDDNCHNYCSCGLHVGTWEYASDFGQVVVAVEVNPADVVSVPVDCNCEKCRVSAYKVLQIVSDQFRTTDVIVTNAVAKETTNTPRSGKGSTAIELIKRHGWGNLEESINRNIKKKGGKTTIEQLRGSTGRRFGMTSADILNILLHMGYNVTMNDTLSKSVVML